MTAKEKVLLQLEELLEAIPDDKLPPVSCPDPNQATRRFAKVCSRFQMISDYIVGALSQLLSSTTRATPFRVCNIGCGTGELECIWLSQLHNKFPDLRVQYVGVDIDETVCKVAETNLQALDFVELRFCCQDIQYGLDEEKFDCILFISSFYYMQFPEKTLKVCNELIIPKGLMLITLGSQQPFLELFSRFWFRNFRYDICFPSKLQSVLKTMKISFSEDVKCYSLDLRACLQDRFSKPDQKSALWGLTQVNTFQYPSAVVDKCIEFLEIICKDSLRANEVMATDMHFFLIHK